jgi:hypothetical protein
LPANKWLQSGHWITSFVLLLSSSNEPCLLDLVVLQQSLVCMDGVCLVGWISADSIRCEGMAAERKRFDAIQEHKVRRLSLNCCLWQWWSVLLVWISADSNIQKMAARHICLNTIVQKSSQNTK